MDQVMLSSSLLDLLQSLLLLPLTLLAYVGWVLEKTLSCDTSVKILAAAALLGIPLGLFYDALTGLIIVLGATVEMYIVALFCVLPDLTPNLLEISMLAVSPEVLRTSLRSL